MVIADFGSGTKKIRKPKSPKLPVNTTRPPFTGSLLRPPPLSTDVDTSRPKFTHNLLRPPPSPPISTQIQTPDIALSAVAALHQRQQASSYSPPMTPMAYHSPSSTPSPTISTATTSPRIEVSNSPSYGGYASSMEGQYTPAAEASATSVRTYKEMEDRVPGDTVTESGIKALIAKRLSRRGGMGIINPMSPIAGYQPGITDTSDFGPQTDPITGAPRNHTGDDMSVPEGTPIYAPVGGVVSTSTPDGGAYGNQVIMDHGAGQQTMFGHLSQLAVPPGTTVKKGDIIGYVGSTGRSTGPHLHMEAWQDGQPFDPDSIYGPGYNQEEHSRIISERALQYAQRHPESLRGTPEPTPVTSVPSDAQISYDNRAFKQMPQPNDPIDSFSKPTGSNALAQIGDQLAGNPQLDALMHAIREQESGGNYSVQNGIGAAGAYQIMPSNIEGTGGWDAEALGQEITGQQFLNSPQLQNQIAKFKLKDYFSKYGAAGAAKAWYAGPGNATLNSNGPQYGGPSVNAYADSVLNLMRKYQQPSGQ